MVPQQYSRKQPGKTTLLCCHGQFEVVAVLSGKGLINHCITGARRTSKVNIDGGTADGCDGDKSDNPGTINQWGRNCTRMHQCILNSDFNEHLTQNSASTTSAAAKLRNSELPLWPYQSIPKHGSWTHVSTHKILASGHHPGLIKEKTMISCNMPYFRIK